MAENKLIEFLNNNPKRYFTDFVIQKSLKYNNPDKIKNICCDLNSISADIYGKDVYNTSITLKDGTIKFRCSCPVESRCKHEAALIMYAMDNIELIKSLQTINIENNRSKIDYSIANLNDNINIIIEKVKEVNNSRILVNGKTSSYVYKVYKEYIDEEIELIKNSEFEKSIILYLTIRKSIDTLQWNNLAYDNLDKIYNELYEAVFDTIINNYNYFIEKIYIFDNDLIKKVIKEIFNNSYESNNLFSYNNDFYKNNIRLLNMILEECSCDAVDKFTLKYYLNVCKYMDNDLSCLEEIKANLSYFEYVYLYSQELKKLDKYDEIIKLLNDISYMSVKDQYKFLMIDCYISKKEYYIALDWIYKYLFNSRNKNIKYLYNNYIKKLDGKYIAQINKEAFAKGYIEYLELDQDNKINQLYIKAIDDFEEIKNNYEIYYKENKEEITSIYLIKAMKLCKSYYVDNIELDYLLKKIVTFPNSYYYLKKLYRESNWSKDRVVNEYLRGIEEDL